MPTPGESLAFKPRNIAVADRDLALAWSDDHESYYPFDELRRACPCATCRAGSAEPEPESGLRVVTGPRAEEIAIRELRPVGAYAVQVVWSDGHEAGIYAFEALRRACPCGDCRGRFAGP